MGWAARSNIRNPVWEFGTLGDWIDLRATDVARIVKRVARCIVARYAFGKPTSCVASHGSARWLNCPDTERKNH